MISWTACSVPCHVSFIGLEAWLRFCTLHLGCTDDPSHLGSVRTVSAFTFSNRKQWSEILCF